MLQNQGLPAAPPAVDYLHVDGSDTAASYVTLAKTRGIRTICYLNVGSAENNRPAYSRLSATSALLGNAYPGFASERYIDIRCYPEFIQIMNDRLSMCRGKGFDYVKIDVMDAFKDGSVTDLPPTKHYMINYVTAMSARARSHGLKPVQETANGSATKLVTLFDAILFEYCVLGNFCGTPRPMGMRESLPMRNIRRTGRARTRSVSAAAKVATTIMVVDLDRPGPDRCS
jgi:hypothetical protein